MHDIQSFQSQSSFGCCFGRRRYVRLRVSLPLNLFTWINYCTLIANFRRLNPNAPWRLGALLLWIYRNTQLHAYATFDPVDPCLFSLNQHLFVIILMRIESWSVGRNEADWRWVRVSSLYHFLAGYLVSKLMSYTYIRLSFIITMNIYIFHQVDLSIDGRVVLCFDCSWFCIKIY